MVETQDKKTYAGPSMEEASDNMIEESRNGQASTENDIPPGLNSEAITTREQHTTPNTNNSKVHGVVVSRESTPATVEVSSTRIPRTRSLVPSIVIRRTEETLQTLQSDLHHASVDLLRTLGNYLSQQDNSRSVGGISLPAAAVSWLASQSNVQLPTTRLTHLRISAETWPKQSSKPVSSSHNNESPPSSTMEQDLLQQYSSLQALHRLRFNPQMDITVFPSLKVLLLDQVPPDWVLHLPNLQQTLEVLRVERASLNDLKEFLLGRDTPSEPISYSKLSHLKLSHCNLGSSTRGLAAADHHVNNPSEMPLAHMPRLTFLSLAHNHIRSEDTIQKSGLSEAAMLSKLDLSYNQIPSMIQAPLYIGNLQQLILTGNRLESADGIDRLYALQVLALDKNNIRSWLQVKGLARLPELKTLQLRGNPFMETSPAERKYVRVMLLDLFRDQRWASSVNGAATTTFRQLEFILPVIDGKPVSDRELRALQQRAFVTVPARAQEGRRIHPASQTCVAGVDESTTNALSEDWTLISASGEGKVIHKKKRKAARAIIEDGPAASRSDGRHGLSRSGSTNAASAPVASLAERNGVGTDALSTVNNNSKKAGNSRGPDVSFNINDIILSLGPNGANSKTQKDQSQNVAHVGEVGETILLQSEAKAESSDTNNHGKDGASKEEFAWPQPLPYLPKENLYEEFVWNPPVAAISLNEEKPKPKSRKKTKTQPKKLKKKPPPAIKTDEAGLDRGNITRTIGRNASLAAAEKTMSGSSLTTKVRSTGMSSNASISSGISLEARDKRLANGNQGFFEEQSGIQPARHYAYVDESSANASSSSTARGAPPQSGEERRNVRSCIRSVSSDDGDDNDLISPSSAAFPAMAMEVGGADDLTCSSMGTNMSNAGSRVTELQGPNRQDKFHLAEIKSKWLGVEQERSLVVASNLELYFQKFVFPDFVPNYNAGQLNNDTDTWQYVFFNYPRIQLLPKDRDLRESHTAKKKPIEVQTAGVGEDRERLFKVWKEDVVACGKPALRRLPPNRTAHFGFHGELSWLDGKVKTVSECRRVILCLSNTSLYVILDNDSLTEKEKKAGPRKGALKEGTNQSLEDASPTRPKRKTRKFASPLPADATFEQALWPHAVACHPLSDIVGITIGFGFQRMTLRIRNSAYPSAVEYTYQLLTSNKMKTVTLLRDLQILVKEVKLDVGHTTLTDEPIKIDNDDRHFLDGLAATVAPEPLGAVLHYQILKQRWKHGQRGAVSRICVVTDAKIFLLDEDYIGDGSLSVSAQSGRRLGSPAFRLIDSADLKQIAEVKAADADPNAITIIIRPLQTLQRTHRWRLLCRDRTGAEKLVEDVRKGMAMAD